MRLAAGKGIKGVNHYPNFLLKSEDMLYLSTAFYQNITDSLACVVSGRAQDRAYVLSGLGVVHSSGLMATVSAGCAVSFAGYYLDENGAWGYVASAGDIFSIIVPEDFTATFAVGHGTFARIDIVEARPKVATHNPLTRQYRDPITGVVSSAVVDTRAHYFYEFQVVAGTPSGSPVAPASTAGWVKLAEVTVNAGSSTLNLVHSVTASRLWTTAAESTRRLFDHTAPSASANSGYEGEIRADSSFIYIYKNSAWRRVGIATF